MKRLLTLILLALVFYTPAMAANSQATGTGGLYFEEATVDTDPGANGYGCNEVSILAKRGADAEEIRFYIESIASGATITLQWKRSDNSTWTDYDDYTTVIRKVIRDNSHGVWWRAIVKDDAQGTGTSIFGIDW